MKDPQTIFIEWLAVGVFLLLHFPVSIRAPPGCMCKVGDVEYQSGDWRTLSDGLFLYPVRNSSSKHQEYSHSNSEQAPVSDCRYTSEDASMTLDTIDKLVNSFYADNVHKFGERIDSSFGLRGLMAQLEYLLEEKDHKLSPDLKSLFGQLRKSSSLYSSMITDEVLRREDIAPNLRKAITLLREHGYIYDGKMTWAKPEAIAKHFHEFKDIGNEKEVIDSDLDLKCITHLVQDCSLPQLCKATYRRDIYSQYMLTHQTLYQLVVKKRSCASLNPEAFENYGAYGERLCSKAYLETEFLASHDYPTRFVDLFAEYVGMCGLLGYPNFMRADWLREIISWREGSASGCMADLYGKRKLTDTKIQVRVVGRQDGKSEEDCLVHLSSVSLAALAVNLRYMVDVCGSSLFDDYFSTRA